MTTPVRLGRYTIGERLGEGGAAEVFRGEIAGAEGFSRQVAVKRIRPEVAREPAMSAAFFAEAQLAKQLHHGNIVQIYDVGDEEGLPFLVVELVDGVALAEVVRHHPQGLPVVDALYVIEQVCAALHYAHERTDDFGRPAGIVHRDINPKNILVSKDGVVKLADFGIAKPLSGPAFTLPGLVKGTLGYLSPEQARGGAVGPASDQFSAALVLYEMLTGQNPLVTAKDLVAYRELLQHGLPPLAGKAPVDGELRAVIARALSPAPEARFASIGDFGAELEAWRVARKLRTSPSGIRDAVRQAMGMEQTAKQPRMLADALGYLHAGTRPRTEAVSAAPPARPRAGRAWALAGIGVAIAAILVGIAVAAFLSGGPGVPNGPGGAGGPSAENAESAAEAPAPAPRQAADAAGLAAVPASAVPAPAVTASTTPASTTPAPLLSPDSARAASPDAGREPSTTGEASGKRVKDRERARPPAARSAPGRIKINVIPWANVHIDGKHVGRTPVDESVPPGSHRIFLHNPSTGQELERQVTIQSEQVLSITSW